MNQRSLTLQKVKKKNNFADRIKGQNINLTQQIIDKANELNRPGLIHLSIGVPDFPVNPTLKRSVLKAMNAEETRYTSTAGLPELRRLVAKNYKNFSSKENILITTGSSEAVFLVLGALINTGDEVVIISPAYFIYSQGTRFYGGNPVEVPLEGKGNKFYLDMKKVEAVITPKTKLIILNSPNNPTGWMADRDVIQQLVNLANKHKIYLLSDEIYKDFTYGHKFYSPERYSERVIVVDGISKTYSATGLRIGWLAANKTLIQKVLGLHQLIVFSSPTPMQYAVLALLKSDQRKWIKSNQEKLLLNRDKALKILSGHDGEILPMFPDGAFYIFCKLNKNGKGFAERLLEKENVTVVPGEDYGSKWKNYIRIAFCKDTKKLVSACHRINKACRA